MVRAKTSLHSQLGKPRKGGILVKKIIVIPSILILFTVGVSLAPLLFAQAPAAQLPRGTKVGVVNVRAILQQNTRAKALQADLEEAIKPHKLIAATLTTEIDTMKWSDEVLAKKKSQWEAVNAEILRLIEDKHKEKLPAVWKEVHDAVDAAAKTYGFQIILGYGDLDDAALKSFHQAKTSKVRAMDMGCTAMLYVHGSVDLTPVVIAMLKSRTATK